MQRKQQNDSGDDGGLLKCVINVLNKIELIDALLEHPEFKRNLQRICRTLTRNAADADDLYNEASLKVAQKIDKFDPDKSNATFVGWLRTLVRNLYFDRFRPKSLVIDDTPSDELHGLRDPGADPYEQLWQTEFEKELNKWIAKLEKDRDRLILTYYFQSFSFREIQEILEEKHGIRTTHVTVRNTVRKLLKEFFDIKMSIPAIDRKANKPSKRPVVKAQIKRKANKISRRRSGTRRLALKK